MSKTQHDSEIPAEGQQVITAVAFIYRRNENGEIELFLPKRAETKKFLPGVFELPGGHIDFGEQLIPGLKREILEEFGVNLQVEEPFEAFTYLNEVKGSHSVEIVYFAKFSDPLEKISLDPTDHSEYIWATKQDCLNNLNSQKGEDDPEVKIILKGFDILANETQ